MKEITLDHFKKILHNIQCSDNVEFYVNGKPYTFGIHNSHALVPAEGSILPHVELDDIEKIETQNEYEMEIYVKYRKEPHNMFVVERLNVFDMI
jgi:hypothetical protein